MSIYSYKYKGKQYWFFRVTYAGKQYGRRLSEGNRFVTKKECEIAESHFLSSLGIVDKKKVIYVYQLYDEYVRFIKQRYKNTSCYSIIKAFENHIFPLIKEERIDNLSLKTSSKINEYLSMVGMKNPKNLVSAAKNFYKFLLQYNVVIPCESIIYKKDFSLKLDKEKIRFWTLEEFNKFIISVDHPYWRLMFLCFYYYGLRVGELRGLLKCNFTKDYLIINNCVTNSCFETGQIDISPKTNSSIRKYPMFENIWNCYCSQKKTNSKYVFSSLEGLDISVGHTTIRRKLMFYCKKSGVPFINVHGFRHSCASLLINKGMDPLQVCDWLGHSNPAITLSTYSHLFEDRKRQVFNFLNDLNKK